MMFERYTKDIIKLSISSLSKKNLTSKKPKECFGESGERSKLSYVLSNLPWIRQRVKNIHNVQLHFFSSVNGAIDP